MKYFAYGSNLDPKQIKSRCPDSKFIGVAILKNYRLDFNIYSPKRKCGCADIVESKNSEVWGYLYELSETDLLKLDQSENVPVAYKRIQVEVYIDSQSLQAFTYTVVSKSSFIPPSKAYLNIIITAAKENTFPDEYLQMLQKIETTD